MLTHDSGVTSVVIYENGNWIVTSTKEGTVTIWERETETIVQSISAHKGEIFGVDITPDGNRVVSACEGEMVKVWDVPTGLIMSSQPCPKFNGYYGWNLPISPDGKRVVYGLKSKQQVVWDLATGEIIHQTSEWGGVVTGARTKLVYKTSDSQFAVFDLVTGAETSYDISDFYVTKNVGNGIILAADSPDGKWLVLDIWYDYGSLQFFLDLENQTGFSHEFTEGDMDVVNAIALTPDSKEEK